MDILLVDDDSREHRLFSALLEMCAKAHDVFYKLELASNLTEANAKLSTGEFDMIFLDDRLADSQTSERSLAYLGDKIADTPVVVISACVEQKHLFSNCNGKAYAVIDKMDLIKKMPVLLVA